LAAQSQAVVPLVDLVAQYRTIQPEIDQAVAGVIGRAAFVGGAENAEFETKFAAFCEARHAVGVGNGTDALFLALKALGIGAGQEVIVPANTFIATSEAVTAAGAKPVFVDVDEGTATISVAAFQAAITPRTAAVIPVHLYGRSADMAPIVAAAKAHGIAVVEDAAQAHGARYQGKRVGTLGDVACFSFYPGKNLGAYGDGGAVVTNDEALAKRVRMLRDHGRKSKYLHETEGHNSRLDNLQAAVLLTKLPHLQGWNEKRVALADLYRKLLEKESTLHLMAPAKAGEHVYHLFVVRTRPEHREAIQKSLSEAGISTGIHYPVPLHLQPAYSQAGYKKGVFPVTERLANEVLSLPMYAELPDATAERIAHALASSAARS